MKVKIKAIKAMRHIWSSQLIDASRLLSELEGEVANLENCEPTAWYYLAKTVLCVKEMQKMKYKGVIRQHHKSMCSNNIYNARACFLSAGKQYQSLATAMLWWLCLLYANMTNYELEKLKSETLSNVSYIKSLNAVDKNQANDYLHQFIEESKMLKAFPSSDIQDSLVLILQRPTQDVKSESTTDIEG